MKKVLRPFHLAQPVPDIQKAKAFYHELLGLELGREAETWVDIDFFGHQLVFHQAPEAPTLHANPVDNHSVPVPHFGIVLDFPSWDQLALKLKKADVQFIIEPTIRFEGQPGEQGTLFFKDPNGLALEFKAFKNDSMIFEK